MTADRYDLKRFLDAQGGIYAQVTGELRRGRKQTHWMWFVFPQIKGLGHSAMAQKYAISSLDEARAYLLFAKAAADHGVFDAALAKYFASTMDRNTLDRL